MKLELNKLGRDFVCGDLHGSLTCLTNFMSHVNFDKSCDRMIAVGDLIDRGPDSLGCLRLLNESWFFTVKGNHEDLMDAWITGAPMGRYWYQNGGDWFNTLSEEEKRECYKVNFDALPLVITVDLPDNKMFHVIHAELFDNLSDEQFLDAAIFKKAASVYSDDGECVIWGRRVFYDVYGRKLVQQDLDYLKTFADTTSSTVYSGHTILDTALFVGSRCNLDTAAFMSYKNTKRDWALTVTEPFTNKFWKVTENTFSEVEPLYV